MKGKEEDIQFKFEEIQNSVKRFLPRPRQIILYVYRPLCRIMRSDCASVLLFTCCMLHKLV